MIPGFGFLADLFTDPYLVKWEIADGVARSDELPGVAVPGGDVRRRRRRRAVARAARGGSGGARSGSRSAGGPVADPVPESAVPPAAADGLRTIPPRETGGNLDIRQLVAGSRLYLPVDVPGALFSIGDLHFAQGDGEVCGTAIEVAGSVTVALHVHRDHVRRGRLPDATRRPARPGPALVRDDGHPGRRRDGSDRRSPGGAERDDRPPRGDARVRAPAAAYALCSAVVDLRLSEVVDVPYPSSRRSCPLDVLRAPDASTT